MKVYMHFFLYAGTGVFGRGGNLIQVTEKIMKFIVQNK